MLFKNWFTVFCQGKWLLATRMYLKKWHPVIDWEIYNLLAYWRVIYFDMTTNDLMGARSWFMIQPWIRREKENKQGEFKSRRKAMNKCILPCEEIRIFLIGKWEWKTERVNDTKEWKIRSIYRYRQTEIDGNSIDIFT